MVAFVVIVLIIALFHGIVHSRPTEAERVQLWYKANNTWPPKWQPETPEFKAAMTIREEEIMHLPGANERWENWMQVRVY